MYYKAIVNFCGFIGSDENYEADTSSEEEAEDDIREQARDDLEVTEIKQVDDDEYEVTVRFAGFIGVEETYTVYADSEEEAEIAATEEASYDLNIELDPQFTEDDDDDDYDDIDDDYEDEEDF